MKRSMMSLAVITACCAAATQNVHATVIDFAESGTPSFCTSDLQGLGAQESCGNWSYISQAYGDVAGAVDVSYLSARTTDNRSMRWWASNYNSLYGVAWADFSDANSEARIDIVALAAGTGIRLDSFQLGAYSDTTRSSNIRIRDLANNNILFSSVNAAVGGPGNTPTTFSFSNGLSSSSGIRIEFFDSAYNVGIDKITYQVTGTGAPNPVPEPAALGLVALGLGALAGLRRRKA